MSAIGLLSSASTCVRSLIHEEGIEPGRVSVIGDPRSNAARLVPTARLREEVRRDVGLAPGRPLIVLVSKYVSLLFLGAGEGSAH